MKDANAVHQTRMRSTRINKVGKSELLYASKTLKRTGLDYAPQHALQLGPIEIKLDEVVEWIAYALLFRHRASE
jgi:hypothetical protein